MSNKTENELPQLIYAQASIKSVGGTSLFNNSKLVTSNTVPNFYSETKLIDKAVEKLKSEGFQVLQINPVTVNIAAPPNIYEKVFKTKIIPEEKEVIKKLGKVDMATFLDSPDTDIPGLIDTSKSSLSDFLEGVAIEEPRYFFESSMKLTGSTDISSFAKAKAAEFNIPSAFPPPKEYWHLNVPADISLGLNAELAHRDNFTGRGVSVAMIDSGWYKHPFFIQHGYHVNPVVLGPAATNPEHDESGHGTGESANIFAVAPDVNFTMVKDNFVNTTGAFNTAISLHPQIISCSWGSNMGPNNGPLTASDITLAAAISNAVNKGIIVIFSAGNGHWGFPGQHPDVISAGGVYMGPDESLGATPYASGFTSPHYPGRNVPDVSGLVGLDPNAQYIMLPVENNNKIDSDLSGGKHPNGDETTSNDSWAAFSGTSAAAPQLAGVCALMREACPDLSPAAAREILKKTARDVTVGRSAQKTGNNSATVGPDLATGYGLVDAYSATIAAKRYKS